MVPRILIYDHLDQPLFEIDPQQLYALKMVEKVNGEHSLTITTSQELEKGQRVFTSVDGRVREFVVTGDTATRSDGFQHEYYCVWSLMNDLSGDYIDDRRIGNKNDLRGVGDILQVIADSGRWQVGTVSSSTLSSAWLYYTSSWDALGRAVENWLGEVDATIAMGSPIVRSIDFYSKLGDQTPKRRFDYGHDLTSIKRTVLDDLYVCRIVPRGKGEQVSTDPDAYGRRITIEDVNPTGEEWIQDDAAALLVRLPDGNGDYTYPTQIVIYESIEDEQELYDTAMAELETYTRPKVSYDADVMALSGAGLDANGVSLGDAVDVVDLSFGSGGLRLSARVLGMERDLLDPSNDKLTIGNFQPQLADVVAKLSDGLSAAQEQLIDTDGKADAAMSDASAATIIANAAQSVANAVNQHFWDDSDGAHVTEVTKDEWLDALNPNYHKGRNTLWNTLGILFRNGLTNLLAVLAGSTPASRGIAVYDGLGNASTNIVASFTGNGFQVGSEADGHLVGSSSNVSIIDGTDKLASFDSGSVDFYDGAGNTSANITASFGASGATIGKTSESHVTIDSTGMKLSDPDGNGSMFFATDESMDAASNVRYGLRIADAQNIGTFLIKPGTTNAVFDGTLDALIDGDLLANNGYFQNDVEVDDRLTAGEAVLLSPLDVGSGGTGASNATDACTNLNAARVSNQSAQNVFFTPLSSASQTVGISYNVTNSSDSYYGDRMIFIIRDQGFSLYDSTNSTTEWQVTFPSGVTNFDVTTSEPTLNSSATATNFDLRKQGSVVSLQVYQLKVAASLADAANVSIGSAIIPSAYRPKVNTYIPLVANVNGKGAGCFLYITTGGNVSIYNRSGSALGTGTNLNCSASWIV